MEEQKKQPVINLVQKPSSFKLVIPAEVEQKIRFICNNVWSVEWSGTLFYTHEGSFDDGTLVITAKDIFVMDIGTGGYTEFDMSPDVISYMTDHLELLDCQMGLIHSHNNMPTFFSGTDTNTLREEGIDRNHFVSLIVNNAGKYTARITRRVKISQNVIENIEYESFDDEHKEAIKEFNNGLEQLEHYNLEIIKQEFNGFDELKTKLEDIRKSKANNPNVPNAPIEKIVECQGKHLEKPKVPELNSAGYNYYGAMGPTPVQKEIPFEDLDETKMPNNGHFDDDTVKSCALQLVTGSIVIPNSSSIDIHKWITSMPKVYEKRFGTSPEGFKTYEVWVGSLVEFILMYTEESSECDELTWSVLAQDIIDYLAPMPKNKYIQTIIDELVNYVM